MFFEKKAYKSGFTFVSAVIIVAVLSLTIWASLILTDIILKSSMIKETEEEMEMLAEGLREFFRDCDQFPKEGSITPSELNALEVLPSLSVFYGTSDTKSYRRSHWDGPYIQDKYDDDGYLRDIWGEYFEYSHSEDSTSCTVKSYGPNRVDDGGTGDDIVVVVRADDILEEKIRNVKGELAYINARAREFRDRYCTARGISTSDFETDFESYFGHAFSIDDLFDTYGCDTTGLVSWWKMDESSWSGISGEVTDSAGSNDGTAYGGATTVAGGKLVRCGYFDGSDDYVDCGSNSSLNIGSQITVEAWIKPIPSSAGTASRRIINKSSSYSSSAGNGYLMQLWSNDRIYYYIAVNGNFYAVSQSTPFPHDNDFHFVAMVGEYNNDTGASTLYIYLDGRQIGSRTASGSFTNSTSDLYIGRGISGYFPGYIDEVRIWNRALPASDVLLEYLRGTYLVDWAYKYDEWQMEYQWDSANDEFYSCGRDRVAGTDDDIYQTE
jgi:hypothetical protein